MQQNGSSDFDIRYYWGILLKRKYVVVAVFLAILSLFTWGSLIMPKKYEASSTVLIENGSIIDPLITGVGVSSSISDRLRNLRDQITSRNLLERVIMSLDEEIEDGSTYKNNINSIKNNLHIAVQRPHRRAEQIDFFKISFVGNEPKFVTDFVNTLVTEFIEENESYQRTDIHGAYEFIEGQLLEYKRKLEESDREIREFREKNPQMVPQSESAILQRIESFQTTKIDSEITLKELIRKKENLEMQE